MSSHIAMSSHSASVAAVLQKAIENQDIPSAVAVFGSSQKTYPVLAFGVTRYGGEAVNPETRYDLASLSKVVSTLPAILKLCSEGELSLDAKVSTFFSHAGWFQSPSLADVSIRQLLTHSSGLAAWRPLFSLISERSTGIANLLQSKLEHPTGSFVYSDLGFMILGAIIERVSKQRQDSFVSEKLFTPLEMFKTSYGPIAKHNVAATEDCGWRNQLLEGIVHDENAFCLNQVAGHAGLFGIAQDLAKYAQAWLRLDSRLGSEELLEQAIKEQLSEPGIRRGLAWALKGQDSFAGSLATQQGYGHTGFTGTSLWLEPQQDWFAVLLTNRVHPSRHRGEKIHSLRQAFHEAVAQELA